MITCLISCEIPNLLPTYISKGWLLHLNLAKAFLIVYGILKVKLLYLAMFYDVYMYNIWKAC